MKRSGNHLPLDKETKKRKSDKSIKQQGKSAANAQQESSATKSVVPKSNSTIQGFVDPLFAGITKKIMGDIVPRPLPTKATATVTKNSPTKNVKGRNLETLHQAKQKAKKLTTKPKKQKMEPSVVHNLQIQTSATSASSSGRRVPEALTSSDTSSDDDEPLSFVSKLANTHSAKVGKNSATSIQQDKTKSHMVFEDSSSETSSSEEDSPVARKNTVTGKKIAFENQLNTTSPSSAAVARPSPSLPSFKKVAKMTSTDKETTDKQVVKLNGGDSIGLKQGSTKKTQKRIAPSQPKIQPKKQVKSKEMISDNSSSDSSDTEPHESEYSELGSFIRKLPTTPQTQKSAQNDRHKNLVPIASTTSQKSGNVAKIASEKKQISEPSVLNTIKINDSLNSKLPMDSDSDEPVSFVSPPRPSIDKEKSCNHAAPPRPSQNVSPDTTNSRNALQKKTPAPGSSSLGWAVFRKQPPMCVRKTNIIEMEISLHDYRGKPVEVESASFIGFMDNGEEPAEERTRNGIHYRVTALLSDGTHETEDIYLRVVDGRDGQVVRYQGSDTAEELQRVLITHEVTCARCRKKETCGTRSKTPGYPVILDGKVLKFHVRCNTTCAVTIGGRVGKNNNRTFRFVFSSTPEITEASTLASSVQVNVHHNTKMKRLLDEGFNPFTREWGEPLPVV